MVTSWCAQLATLEQHSVGDSRWPAALVNVVRHTHPVHQCFCFLPNPALLMLQAANAAEKPWPPLAAAALALQAIGGDATLEQLVPLASARRFSTSSEHIETRLCPHGAPSVEAQRGGADMHDIAVGEMEPSD
jgi:hypothetical protein